MTFLWPAALVLMLVVPAFLAFYVVHEKRKRASLRGASIYRAALGLAQPRSFARHAPLVIFLVGISAIAFAVARPQAVMTLFSVKGTIVLAVDVSISMKAEDRTPSRIIQAQAVAKDFVAEHADHFRIGVVGFGGTAAAMIDPTTDREQLFAAIDQLTIQRGTAIGTGIAAALNMLLPDADIDPNTLALGSRSVAAADGARPTRSSKGRGGPGSHAPAAIVLISDGQSTTGPDPIEAARLAAKLGVRVHTLGMGSSEGQRMRMDGWSMRVRLDEAQLKEISDLTQGRYLGAATPVDWQQVRRLIRSEFAFDDSYTEVTAVFAALGAFAAVVAALLSLVRTKRVL